jgi:hypothetical protein
MKTAQTNNNARAHLKNKIFMDKNSTEKKRFNEIAVDTVLMNNGE